MRDRNRGDTRDTDTQTGSDTETEETHEIQTDTQTGSETETEETHETNERDTQGSRTHEPDPTASPPSLAHSENSQLITADICSRQPRYL